MLQKATTRCVNMATSLPRIVRESRWVLLRLTSAAGIGILLLVGSAWAVWKTEQSISVRRIIHSIYTGYSLQTFQIRQCMHLNLKTLP